MSAFNYVYVILGIDEHSHDQVLAVRLSFDEAKKFMTKMTCTSPYYDLWIEKHPVE